MGVMVNRRVGNVTKLDKLILIVKHLKKIINIIKMPLVLGASLIWKIWI